MTTRFIPASIQNSGQTDVNGFLGSVIETGTYATGSLTGAGFGLSTVSSAVVGGTTSPVVALPTSSQYLIRGRAQVELLGATFAANQTVNIKIRNTTQSADVSGATATITLPVVTTVTETVGMFEFSSFYSPVSAGDSLTIFASVSVLPSAGSVIISNANVTAVVLPA